MRGSKIVMHWLSLPPLESTETTVPRSIYPPLLDGIGTSTRWVEKGAAHHERKRASLYCRTLVTVEIFGFLTPLCIEVVLLVDI